MCKKTPKCTFKFKVPQALVTVIQCAMVSSPKNGTRGVTICTACFCCCQALSSNGAHPLATRSIVRTFHGLPGPDALQELVITLPCPRNIPDTKTNFKSCNSAIQSDASHYRGLTTRCQILCGRRLEYPLPTQCIFLFTRALLDNRFKCRVTWWHAQSIQF
ncbi:hypothetical protein FB451DRAFT_1293998 [Mycena latifolia]|nr:hypothetical protein FB451DRAFT_1293998 [Mycena latifolia]